MADANLTAERLREYLSYDSETGVFSKRGKSVGFLVPPKNYMRIYVDKRQWLAHRLAWLYVHGVWPAGQIDHINGIKIDNRIANLRCVSPAENMQNILRAKSYNKSSGLLGVTWAEREKKWKAQISVGGISRHLGYADTPDAAHEIYLESKRKLHQGCTI
jgi:hypothetical protein